MQKILDVNTEEERLFDANELKQIINSQLNGLFTYQELKKVISEERYKMKPAPTEVQKILKSLLEDAPVFLEQVFVDFLPQPELNNQIGFRAVKQ